MRKPIHPVEVIAPDRFRVLSDTPDHAPHDIALHLTRRAGGAFDVGERYITCSCKAGQYRAFIGRRAFPGCYAMVETRRVLGLPAIAATGYDARYR